MTVQIFCLVLSCSVITFISQEVTCTVTCQTSSPYSSGRKHFCSVSTVRIKTNKHRKETGCRCSPPHSFIRCLRGWKRKGKCEEVVALPASLRGFPSTRCGRTAQEAALSWSGWCWSWGRRCAHPGRLQQEKQPLGSEDPRELRVETER